MQVDRLLTFGSYWWDPHTGQLWRSKQEVSLTGKAAAVLRLSSTFSLDVVRQTWAFKDPADLERTLAAVRKAGLK